MNCLAASSGVSRGVRALKRSSAFPTSLRARLSASNDCLAAILALPKAFSTARSSSWVAGAAGGADVGAIADGCGVRLSGLCSATPIKVVTGEFDSVTDDTVSIGSAASRVPVLTIGIGGAPGCSISAGSGTPGMPAGSGPGLNLAAIASNDAAAAGVTFLSVAACDTFARGRCRQYARAAEFRGHRRDPVLVGDFRRHMEPRVRAI